MQWEREDARFMGVSLMARLVSPRNSCMRCLDQAWLGSNMAMPGFRGWTRGGGVRAIS